MTGLLLAGALAGLGLALIAAEARPAPPRLDAVLARLQQAQAATEPPPHPAGLDEQIGRWLAGVLVRPRGGLAIPRADLALLGRSTEKFLAGKLAVAAAAMAAPAVSAAVLATAGIGVPWEIPAAASAGAAALMFFFPDLDVRAEAAKRRRDFLHAFTSYLQLVRLARAAGAGASEALDYSAHIGAGWAFTRIAAVLDAARRGHEPPWDGLARLGAEIGVPELAELADLAGLAEGEGTKIIDMLQAKTDSLRSQALAAARGQANSRTTTMIVPLTLLGLGFVLLMAFPAFYTLIST